MSTISRIPSMYSKQTFSPKIRSNIVFENNNQKPNFIYEELFVNYCHEKQIEADYYNSFLQFEQNDKNSI